MALMTRDFPQADKIEQVGKVAIAVANGNTADSDIEKYIGLDSAGRQGRYYRHAAEVLGLITTSQNQSFLTPLGNEYSNLTTSKAQIEFLIRCMLDAPVFLHAVAYINEVNPDEKRLKAWFTSNYPGAHSTANRRFSTFINYIHYLINYKVINISNSKYVLNRYTGAAVKKKILAGQGIGKREFKTYAANNKTIIVEVEAQKKERANITHWNLVTAKSEFLHNRKFNAFENELIDLYAEDKKDIIIYEMKSIIENNFISQLRKAIAQLYEYRYIFSAPTARICMVTNFPIPKKHEWAIDYLTKDREIGYEWTDDFKTFVCNANSKTLLSKFAP